MTDAPTGQGPASRTPGQDPLQTARPLVAGPGRRGATLALSGAALLGVVAFAALNHQRTEARPGPTASHAATAIEAAPPPDLTALEAAARGRDTSATPAATPVAALPPAPATLAQVSTTPVVALTTDPSPERRHAPTLVVDFSAPASAGPPNPATNGASSSAPAAAGPGKPAAAGALNADEQFAERVGSAETDRARATPMFRPESIIPQGAVIPGVLETALNSDLPGFARAVVSRDVRSFDGSRVLIPRGSRVIGQYRSAVAQGQSRAFVIWTRIQRPDGASIQIGSPGADQLGRAGLEGQVDRHFFQQFGGSILLSVIDASLAGLSRRPGAEIIIGSSQDAAGLGAGALRPTAIPPTIKVAQGAPIRIFVARDLDFSPVPDAGR